MPYLIDGNNLMPVVGAKMRKELLYKLANFAIGKNAKITVVFDGAAEDFFPDGSSFKGVKIFYARRYSNADERIKTLVEAEKQKRTLTIVTSDNALANYCRTCGVQVIGSTDFCRKLNFVSNETNKVFEEPTVKPTVKKDEISEWMRYFGVDETDDEL